MRWLLSTLPHRAQAHPAYHYVGGCSFFTISDGIGIDNLDFFGHYARMLGVDLDDCTIADADGHNTYMSATWTKLPYMGEVGGNACIDGVKVSADPTPAEGYFTK